MAPEQLRGEKLDGRADLWAAGAVLYEMATGQHPFPETLAPRLIDSILHALPTAPSALNRRALPALDAIILKCLEKDPDNRYQSAKELVVDLRRMKRDTESTQVALAPTAATAIARPHFPGRHKKVMLGAAIVVLVLAAVAGFWLERGRKPLQAELGSPSIAVLPFVDMSPEKNQEYFSDGLAEELLNALTKIPELRVTARTSSFQFRGKNEDLRVIGQKLNVATILEGSVRKEGKRVRITAQLIKVSDGFHLWSETYDRELTDVFAVQEEIARSVAAALRVTLLSKKAPASRETNSEAYDAYLLGRYFYDQPGKEAVDKALSYYDQAIKLDPGYAPAWAGLALAVVKQGGFQSYYLPVTLDELEHKAREAAERALALDPNLADAIWQWGGSRETTSGIGLGQMPRCSARWLCNQETHGSWGN